MLKGAKQWWYCARQQFYLIFSLLPKKFGWKLSLLVISGILGLFVDTLTADEKYSPRNSESLPQPILK